MKPSDTEANRRRLEALRARIAALTARGRPATAQPELLAEELLAKALAELETSFEELRVSGEELRQRHEQLAEAYARVEAERHRYQDLFDFAPDASLVTDLRCVIQEANRAAGLLFAVQPDSLIGKPLATLIAEPALPAFRSTVRQIAAGGPVREWEAQSRARRGESIDLAITVAPIPSATGKPQGLRWLLRDVSGRKQAEAGQSELLRLRQVERFKNEFISTITHELRTPLTAIIGFGDVLRRQLHGPLNERQLRHVGTILSNADRLLSLVGDLLDISRLESGRIEMHPTAVDLGDAIRRVTEQMAGLIAERGVTVQVDVEPGLPPVRADVQRTDQVLTNLFSNAVKFTEAGGRITVRAAARDDVVQVEVGDTGIGLTPDQLLHVWDRFYQADSSTSRRFGGVGLGLSIVRMLVELMGGEVSAASAGADEGATFSFTLPIA